METAEGPKDLPLSGRSHAQGHHPVEGAEIEDRAEILGSTVALGYAVMTFWGFLLGLAVGWWMWS